MSIQLKEEFDRNGGLVRTEFIPTADQIRYAAARSSLANEKKSDSELLKELGISKGAIQRWMNEYDPHYSQWLYWFMENLRAPIRDALAGIGLDRAMRGEYNFWKDMARTHGAISSDKQEIKLTVSRGVDELASLTPEQLEAEQHRLIGELTGTSVAPPPEAEGPESSVLGTSPLQEGPVALPLPVGSDGGLPGPDAALQAVSPEAPPSLTF